MQQLQLPSILFNTAYFLLWQKSAVRQEKACVCLTLHASLLIKQQTSLVSFSYLAEKSKSLIHLG